jgi:YhcH/YjgK/YiaL family protein
MIVDTLRNSILYRGLSPRIALAFDYLQGADFQSAETGTFEIAGRNVFAMIQEYATVDRTQGVWEAHRRYIDLQFVASGAEQIGYTHLGRLAPGRYDEARDLLTLAGADAGSFLTCGPGDFMLLFPEDAHMPRIAVAAPGMVRKIVVKIAVSP